ncbi:probable Glycerol kinase [Saccharomycodes ludwigii]|uniref:glycerol kinase n=1 Tax=Saccharomycodes ludwigii TaxID=36035 RepID=A0A376B986_9ASCO|nr:probable Glycerol kinase [Saccharomycodes ludwigii]
MTVENKIVPLVASIDVGTTSTRVILFNKKGLEIAKHQIEYSTSASLDKASEGRRNSNRDSSPDAPLFSAEGVAIEANQYLEIEDLDNEGRIDPTLRFPKPGWVECNPLNILANVVQCFTACLVSVATVNKEREENGFDPYKVVCIGVANMRETTIVWSKKTGLPVYKYGIVWNDVRTLDLVTERKKNTPEEKQAYFRAKSGVPIFSTYFSCSKLRWLLDNDEKVKEAYESGDLMFGTVDSWLIYHLTKQKTHVTDVSNASRTGFMNLSSLQYDDELLEYWGVDKNKIILPKIVSSSEYYGDFSVPTNTKSRLTAYAWDLLKEFVSREPAVPIQGCLGDQSASLVGQMAFKPGSAKCTYGTGCFMLYNTGPKKLLSKHGALTTLGYWFPHLDEKEHAEPHFALEGSVAVAGSVVQWLRDNLRLVSRAEDVGPLAVRVPNTGGVVFVPAFSGLFAPYWDPSARGTILGLSQYTTASHIARAALEGVCFQARAILKAMSSDARHEGKKDKHFKNEVKDNTYEQSVLSSLSVDGGMSKSDEVMQIQANILGPCVKVKRSKIAESTAFGAAIAAAMAYENPSDRPLWKNFKDIKENVLYGGRPKEDAFKDPATAQKIFLSNSTTEDRRQGWTRWEAAIQRAEGWMTDSTYKSEATNDYDDSL